MTAEGTPPAESSYLSRLLVRVTRLVIRFPVATLILSLLALAISLILSSTHLDYHTSRSSLIGGGSDYQRRWQAYVDEFGDKEDVVVVVQGPGAEQIVPVIDQLAAEIAKQSQHFHAVLHMVDLTKIRGKGLHFLPLEQLQCIDRFLDETEPIVRGGWSYLSPGPMAAGMIARLQGVPPEQMAPAVVAVQQKLGPLADSFLSAVRQPGSYQSPWPEMTATGLPQEAMTSRHLLTENGRMGFILLKLADDSGDQGFVRDSKTIDALREILAQAKVRHPKIEIGLTGLPVMENDEMRSSQSSMSLATILSLSGVLLVLVAGFGGVRHSLLAMAALMSGMVWSLGYTTLFVGHLNILSSAFGAILTGLGINYGVYVVARYLQLREARCSTDEALLGTAGSVAPGITIGAATTAIAFYMAGFTEFTGVAELGLVAGGGIVLCWWAAMSLLPAMIRLSDAAHPERPLPTPLAFHRWIEPLLNRPRLVVALSLAATALVALGLGRLWYDHNLLNLQPMGMESVELERKLLAETKESAWFALSMAATPGELLVRKEQFAKLPAVERVEEIASLFPAQGEQKRPLIQRIQQRLQGLPEQAPSIPVAAPAELGQMLQGVHTFLGTFPQGSPLQEKLEQIGSLLGRLPMADYYARISDYQQRLAGDLLGRLRLLRAAANPEPPQPADLPPGLVSRYIGRHGQHLLKIYSKNDIWDRAALEQFVNQVRSVDREATGNPLQVYEASEQMRRSFEQATYLAMAAILPVVFLSFGSIRCTLLAILPLVLGTLQMFGLMGLLDLPMNPANMIALPLMLGMGVDNGVHIIHDFRSQHGRYRMSASTGVAVVLNTLTTMVGFAVLIIADHRGLQSLGRVLTIGMSCCLFSSLVILPPLLAWMTSRRALSGERSPHRARTTIDSAVFRIDAPHTGVPAGHVVPRRVARHHVALADE